MDDIRKQDVMDGFFTDPLADSDPELAAAIGHELVRQQDQIEMIASENIVSTGVLEAQGSVLTNKYAEGYSGRRYYGGCEHVDVVETLAIERAKKLFGAAFVNVQPHSGAQANQAVFLSLLKPGDTILGMSLAAGGHLTHGAAPNLSGKWFNAEQYGVDEETAEIDFDALLDKAKACKPKIILAGGSAYPRTLDFAKFREIADAVDAYLMVDMAHISGLVAAGVHPNPVPHAHVVTSTTHKTLRAGRGGIILSNDEALGKKINSAVFPGMQGGPLMHAIAAKAVAFKEAMEPGFRAYQELVVKNAQVMASVFIERGFKIVSGGTDNHLMLVDLVAQEITGKAADAALGESHITVNKNAVPFDDKSPFVTSGIRVGVPAVTTRGMKEEHMATVVDFIDRVLMNADDEAVIDAENIGGLVLGLPLKRRQ